MSARKHDPAPGAPAPAGMADTIAGLRALAAAALAGEAAGEAPEPEDAELLEICERVLENKRRSSALSARIASSRQGLIWVEPSDEEQRSRDAEREAITEASRLLMRRANKLSAKTLRGLYAKCLICESSYGGAPGLARTVVRDLMRLRPLVWRAETGQ